MSYPYYIVPDVEEYLRLDPESEKAKRLSRKIAANVGDYMTLRQILGIDPPEFTSFYPDMETYTPSTLDTIDTFLGKFGEKEEPSGRVSKTVEKEENTDLAKLFKNGKYEEVLSLIETENLNNPQKNIYFALQIRYLKKLIALDKYKNKG